MNIRNGYREEKSWCYFHPRQVVVGVCPLCLNERLLILAAKRNHSSASKHSQPSSSSIHKIFAFGSFFNRPQSQHCKSNNFNFDVSPSPEESFISIKFEENGVASWEKSKVSLENSDNKNKSVIEHGKSRDTLRWRKRIGHMFHLIRWKKSGGVCHVSNKVEGVKVRRGWIRTLTKRKMSVE